MAMDNSSPTKIFARVSSSPLPNSDRKSRAIWQTPPNASCCRAAVCENWQKHAGVGSISGAGPMSLPLSTGLTHADLVVALTAELGMGVAYPHRALPPCVVDQHATR